MGTAGNPQLAVLGCGHWGKNLVRAFHRLGGLVSIADPDSTATAPLSAEYGVAARGVEEILQDGNIDAVAVAAPAAHHSELAARALQAGKNVFVEKPLALDVRRAEELCELAERRGLVLMVGHLLQYHPAFRRLADIVGAGVLGRLQYLASNRLNLGRIRREEDILWSFAPHDISMILSLVGSMPDDVTAVGSSYLHKSIADVTTTHLSFPGGEHAHIHVSWLHPFKEQKLVVIGDAAMAVFDDGQPWETKLQLYAHKIDWRHGVPHAVKADAERVTLEPAEPLAVECQHFVDCVRTGTTPRTDGREGLRVLTVLDAAAGSLCRGTSPSGPGTSLSASVHETAVVDEAVEIGEGTRVWHFTHILPKTRIGRNCTIGQGVMIGPDVTVGDNCKIQNNVSVYKGVTLERGVFCGPSCVFTNVLNPRAEIERKDDFRTTLVRRGATIGANATILCGTTLGEYSLVAAGSVVTRDVAPFALVAGVPARRVGWVSHAGERLGEDLVCPRTRRRYVERDGRLEEVDDASG